MARSTVFTINRTQTVRLPAETRSPETVKMVEARLVGQDRIISPAHAVWDSFFLAGPTPTSDFMSERVSQHQPSRESF